MNALATAMVPRGNADIVIRQVPVGDVEVGANVRVDPGELEGLAASIRELGVLQPVKVVAHDAGTYRLVWGQRRLLAARLAGLETIPAIVVDAGDVDDPGSPRAIEQLVENLDRRDLNPIEEAHALREVLDADPKLTQAALAERLGRSPSWLANSLRLLGLEETVQEQVRSGAISASHGKAMVALPAQDQRDLAKRVIGSKLSAHQLEREIEWKQQAADARVAQRERAEKWIPKVVRALETAAIAKDVDVYIAGAYNVDTERLRKGVADAGYRTTGTYPVDRPKNGKCDCTSVRVEIGRNPKVVGTCTDRRHQDRDANNSRHEWEAEQEARRQKHVAIADGFTAAVRAAKIPQPLLRMFVALASSGSWPYIRWEEADLDPPSLIDQLHELIAGRSNRFDDLTLEAIAATFAPAMPAAAERTDGPGHGVPGTIEADRGVDAPLCSCGKPKVDAGHGRWVCTNPDHPADQA